MRRKRFQHMADTLCHMFCGWRQIADKPRLVALGSGAISIDALRGTARFNGTLLDDLAVAGELQAWLDEDLARHTIPKEAVREATLTADLHLDLVPWPDPDPSEQFFAHGTLVRTDRMHRCTVRCTSVIRTEDAEYRSTHSDVEAWPLGWPAA